MKPKFKKDDYVIVDAQRMQITYWPENNEGIFTAYATSRDGGLVRFTYHTSQLQDGEQTITDADVAATGVTRVKRKA